MELGQNCTIPPNCIYRYPFSTLCGVIHTISCFRSSAPKKRKSKTREPKTIKKSHYIYLNKNIRNWDKTLQYLPIVFINTLSTLCGVIHKIACFHSSASKKQKSGFFNLSSTPETISPHSSCLPRTPATVL